MPKRVLSCLLLMSCTGTDTGNPPVVIDHFGTSECKVRPETAAYHSPTFSRAALPTNDALSGLYCVRYRNLGGSKLEVEYINFGASCHADSGFSAAVEDSDGADLMVSLTCSGPTAGCGSCIYDLRYQLDVQDLALAKTISLVRHGCWGGEDVRTTELTFTEADEGLSCQYTNRNVEWWISRLGTSAQGQVRRSCRDGQAPGEQDLPACDEGLVCTPVADTDSRCLAHCEHDEDCELAGVEACVDGLCRLP